MWLALGLTCAAPVAALAGYGAWRFMRWAVWKRQVRIWVRLCELPRAAVRRLGP